MSAMAELIAACNQGAAEPGVEVSIVPCQGYNERTARLEPTARAARAG